MRYENEIREYCRKQDEWLETSKYLELIEYMRMYYLIKTGNETMYEEFPNFFAWSNEEIRVKISEWRTPVMNKFADIYGNIEDFGLNLIWLFPFQPGVRVRDDLDGGKIRVIRKVDYDEFGNAGVWLTSEYLDGGRHPWEISNPVNFG